MAQTYIRSMLLKIKTASFPAEPALRLCVRNAALAAGFIAVYVLLDWMVHMSAAGPLADPPWNPPPGIGLAWLLLFGLSWAPVLFIAALVAELVVRGDALTLAQSILVSALVTGGYAGLATLLRTGPLAIDVHLPRMRDMIVFTLCTTCATLLLATLYFLVQYDFNAIWHLSVARYLIRQWIGDLIGVLVFTPLVLLLWSGRLRVVARRPDAFAHGFGIFIAALLAFWVVYGNVPAEQITSLYLMFLPLIWASLRFGLSGAVVTVVVLQIGVLLLSHLGSQSEATVLQFQIRLLVIAVTGLYLGVAVDELHNTEQKLRERQAELDRTLRLAASAELASAMAHELNQPLSAIGIYTRTCELLLKNRPVPEIRETMAKISVEVRRAGGVVHKLRDFYRSGGSHLETIAVSQLLRNAVDALRERADSNNIAIALDIAENLPPLSVDRMQIETVLHNLLANAIEAIRDAQSGVRLIKLSAQVAKNNGVAITVKDSGPGIAAAEMDQLFRPFSTSKAYGLGLGLSMCRSIVVAHGGILEIIPGEGGCCFCVTLPAPESAMINL